MKKIDPFNIITFYLPPFATWFKKFTDDTTRYNEFLSRKGVDPSLDYLETRHPLESAFISILLGFYLAKSELPTTADPQASRVVLH
jgi:hypothetical protein